MSPLPRVRPRRSAAGNRSRQRELPLPPGRGGRRPGSGRKPKGPRAGVRHGVREAFPRGAVVHVTLRSVCSGLRQRRTWAAVRAAVAGVLPRADFRVVELTLLGNHLHLIVEAADRRALSEGMRSLGTRLARRLNRALARSGRFFADRYHARILRTPLEVRHALLYVLNNARRHAAQRGHRLAAGWLDPFSTARAFTGWSERAGAASPPQGGRAPPQEGWVARAKTWLLREGWRRHGLLFVDAVPGTR